MNPPIKARGARGTVQMSCTRGVYQPGGMAARETSWHRPGVSDPLTEDLSDPARVEARLERLLAEVERLEMLMAASKRDRGNAVKLLALAILAIPAGIIWNGWAALAVVVQVLLLVVGTWYITGVHILEYEGNLEDCAHDLRVVRAAKARLNDATDDAQR